MRTTLTNALPNGLIERLQLLVLQQLRFRLQPQHRLPEKKKSFKLDTLNKPIPRRTPLPLIPSRIPLITGMPPTALRFRITDVLVGLTRFRLDLANSGPLVAASSKHPGNVPKRTGRPASLGFCYFFSPIVFGPSNRITNPPWNRSPEWIPSAAASPKMRSWDIRQSPNWDASHLMFCGILLGRRMR